MNNIKSYPVLHTPIYGYMLLQSEHGPMCSICMISICATITPVTKVLLLSTKGYDLHVFYSMKTFHNSYFVRCTCSNPYSTCPYTCIFYTMHVYGLQLLKITTMIVSIMNLEVITFIFCTSDPTISECRLKYQHRVLHHRKDMLYITSIIQMHPLSTRYTACSFGI